MSVNKSRKVGGTEIKLVTDANGVVTGLKSPTGQVISTGGGSKVQVTGSQTVGSLVTFSYSDGGTGTIQPVRTPIAGGAAVPFGSAVAVGSTYQIVQSDRGYKIGGTSVTYLPPPADGLAIPSVAPLAPTITGVTAGNASVTGAFTRNADNGGDTVTGDRMFVYKASDNSPVGSVNGTNPITLSAIANGVAVYVRVATLGLTNGQGPLSAPSSNVTPSAGTFVTYDIVVYGMSWPGVCAAIRAKQQGRSVLLIDSRDVVGGMTRSGLQFTDAFSSSQFRATIPESGLSNAMFTTLASPANYNIPLNTFYRDYSYSTESKTTGAVIDAMVLAAGITVEKNRELLSVVKSGTAIVSAVFSGIGEVRAQQWIETSYDGTLLAKSGATVILGGESSASNSETAQQAGFVIAGGQGGAIDPYINPGVPGSGLIKYVQNINATGVTAGSAVANKVQFPGYRLSITSTANKKVVVSGGYPFPLPADAIPGDYANWPSKANYELHRRDALLNKTGATGIGNFLNLQTGFPAIPSKTAGIVKRDANNGAFASLDFPDVALNTEYFTPGTTRARRLEIEDIVWQYTLGYLYFIANDPAIPQAARTEIATWGFVNDDYTATAGRPPLMYPRETIRAVGDAGTTLAAPAIIAANNNVSDPCCLAYYAFDKHSRQFIINTVSTVDRVVQEGGTPAAVAASAVGARISSKVLNPQKSQVSNLQVVTTPNATQMFYNSYRVEPIMATAAEYAGIRAALAVSTNTPVVQDVPHASVATIHNLYGLDPVGGTCATVDGVTRTQGTLTTQGTWNAPTSTNICGTSTIVSTTATTGVNTFTYTPLVPSAGPWKLQVKFLDSNSTTRGSFTPVTTVSGVPQAGTLINQNSSAAGVTTNGDWQTVYTGNLTQGDTMVGTSANNGSPMNIVACRIVPV